MSTDCHPLGPVGARPLTTAHQESQAVAGGLGDPPALEGGALENSQVSPARTVKASHARPTLGGHYTRGSQRGRGPIFLSHP